MNTRILLVGTKPAKPPEALSDEVIRTPSIEQTHSRRLYGQASLMDYHICIVDLTGQDLLGLENILWGFLDEFDDFFDGGGVLIVFASRPRTYNRHIMYFESGYRIIIDKEKPYWTYGWLPIKLDARDKQGQSVTFSKGTRIGNVLADSDFIWKCVLEIHDPHTVIARNPSGTVVGAEVPRSDGHLILLPAFKEKQIPPELIRRLIDTTKRDYIGEVGLMIPQPDWIGDYVLKGEKQAVAEFTAAKAMVEKFESAKGLLYLHGKRLTTSISNIFEELGYAARDLEGEGRHDIEIEWKGDKGLLEAKGLKKHAGVKDLRQLSDHFSQAREEAEEKGEEIDIKGISVVNHYRDEHPEKRGDPFTGQAERIGKRDEFCLMTTTQLHCMYSDFLNGELTQKEIHEKIWRTKGLLDYPEAD